LAIRLGSLFDGIGGFPLAASRHGIKTVWASEIEPFPIKVTKHHFPDMEHLGDITQINGADIEPVDIITFGSPCQDLSVAGKRGGLSGERSGLFSHAVRIIREMRDSTGGQYPRFAIWENVPGAFSSNKGEDFRAVLEEIAETEIPMPRSGKWANAGMVRGNGCDIAWRTLDAQYWGVPQRRKRIFLVADFTGRRAGEILFECQGLPGHIAESGKAREEAAAGAGDGVAIPINTQIATRHNKLGRGTGFGVGDDGDPAYTLQEAHSHAVFTEYIPKTVGTLTAEGGDKKGSRGYKGMCTNQAVDTGHVLPVQLYDMTHAEETTVDLGRTSDRIRINAKVSATLQAGGGGSGAKSGLYLIPFGPSGQHDIGHAVRAQPSKADKPSSTTYVVRTAQTSANGHGIAEEKAHTLDGAQRQAVCSIDCRNLYENEEISGTLQCKASGGYSLNYQNPVRIGYAVRRLTPLECERLMGFPDGWTDIPGASDTARYKALGNSIAIPCLDYIFQNMSEVLREGRA
jgi:DNA (cytosine-5)-methyltransferase 1